MKKFLFLLLALPLIFSCKKNNTDEIYHLSQTSVSMNVGDSCQLNVLDPSNVIDTSSYFGTSNPWVATVKSSTGLVKAIHIGTALVTGYKNDSSFVCTVNVYPLSTIYKEPIFIRDASRDDILSYEDTIRGKPSYTSTNNDTLVFKGENSNVTNVTYIFNVKSTDIDKKGSLHMAIVQLKTSVSSNDIHTYMVERYNYFTTHDAASGGDGFTYYLSTSASNISNLDAYFPAYKRNDDQTTTVDYMWVNGN